MVSAPYGWIEYSSIVVVLVGSSVGWIEYSSIVVVFGSSMLRVCWVGSWVISLGFKGLGFRV
jgi:hypothetical protein